MAFLGSKTPIADERYKVVNFKHDEDFENIRSKLLQTGVQYEDECFMEELEVGKVWKRALDIHKFPQFINGKPNRFDAIQGDLEDCWLIAPMEALTMHPFILDHVVPPNQNFTHLYTGAFHFRIWQLGTWYDVVVDDRLPVYKKDGSLCYAHSLRGNVFWAALLEKAYAKVSAKEKSLVDFHDLDQGIPLTALQDLTGGIVEKFHIEKPPFFLKIDDLMKEIHTRNDLMVVSLNRKYHEIELHGLTPHHTYAVTKVYEVTPGEYHGLSFVRIMNPWGTREWKGDWNDDDDRMWRQIDRSIRKDMEFTIREDGEFWMEVGDFLKRYQNLYICHLEPTQFLDVRKAHRHYDTWHYTEARGKWVKDISAVGSDISKRHLNPQYMFKFEEPEPGKETYQTCTVVIELTHRSKEGRVLIDIAFFIYYGMQCPLTHQNLLNLEPINANPNFREGVGCTFVSEAYFRPGYFVVIPCTEDPDYETNYLLRVFSPCPTYLSAQAGTIVKKRSIQKFVNTHEIQLDQVGALPLVERSAVEYNAIPERMFVDKAQGSSEIDWIGLKDILEEAFNPDSSFFGMVLSFLKYIQAYFLINRLRSSDEKYNGKVFFTKDECRSMIAMYDEDHSGKLNISEFCDLWKRICFWTKVYGQYRDKVDGYLKVAQLRDALGDMGYDVATQAVHSLSDLYSDDRGIILLTDFILCGVTLETTLSLVEKVVFKDNSKIMFTLEEWVKKTLIL